MSRKADYAHMENVIMGEAQRVSDANEPDQGMFDLGVLSGFLSKMQDQVRTATVEFSKRPRPDSQG
jgi:hypothetical protein